MQSKIKITSLKLSAKEFEKLGKIRDLSSSEATKVVGGIATGFGYEYIPPELLTGRRF